MKIGNLLAANTFDYNLLRVNSGLASCEDLARALHKPVIVSSNTSSQVHVQIKNIYKI